MKNYKTITSNEIVRTNVWSSLFFTILMRHSQIRRWQKPSYSHLLERRGTRSWSLASEIRGDGLSVSMNVHFARCVATITANSAHEY